MSYRRQLRRGGAAFLLVGLLSVAAGDIGPARPGLAFNPGPPTANAGGPYTADEGAQVTFSGDAADVEDASSALTYEWDFQFSGSFTVAKSGVNLTAPTHTYTDDGSFTVALRVKDTDAEVSAISTAAVTILNVPPSVNAGGPYTVDEGMALVFTGSATDPGEDTLTYEWDFDYDGVSFSVSSSGEDLTGPSNTYTNDGGRTVALRVRDEDGGVSAIETAVVTVSNVPPTASLGISFTGNEGSAVTFSGSATDPGNDTLTYEWDFTYNGTQFNVDQSGDGLNAPQFTYANDGENTVALRVRDDDAISSIVTASVSIANVLPTASPGGPYTGGLGALVTFAGSATDPGNDTLTYEWDFEYDGTTFNTSGASASSGVDLTAPTYAYVQNGTYTVALRVQDDDGSSAVATAQVTISSQSTPTPTPTLTPTPSPTPRGGLVCLNSAARFDKWNHAAVR